MAGSHLNWLSSRERFGVKLGLDSVRALLAELGDPHIDLPAVLVAGTNGKGSTAAMIAAVLTAAGRKTLLYTSPHVASVTERIRIDGTPIRRDALERRLGEVRAAVRRPFKPTYFEVLTAAALLQARACRVTAAVFEIGLGGRYDATNVIPAPVAVITGIEMDHTEYLGTSLKKIAWNKAGIIKKGQTVLTLEPRPELVQVFRDECRRQGATLVTVPAGSARRLEAGRGVRHEQADGGTWRLAARSARRGQVERAIRQGLAESGTSRGQASRSIPRRPADRWDLDLRVARRLAGGDRLPGQLSGVRLGLRGPRQGPQAVLALAAAARLLAVTEDRRSPAISGGMSRSRTITPEKNRSISQSRTMIPAKNRSRTGSSGKSRPLSARALGQALAGVHLPGRFELRRLSQRRLLVADAAHNPAAAALLANEIRDLAGQRPVTLLFSALADKDAEAMLKPFLDIVDIVNLCQVKHRRGMETKDLNDLSRWITLNSKMTSRGVATGVRARGRRDPGAAWTGKPVRIFGDTTAAWKAALAATPPGGILLVAGSFYLLGDLWPCIRRYPLQS